MAAYEYLRPPLPLPRPGERRALHQLARRRRHRRRGAAGRRFLGDLRQLLEEAAGAGDALLRVFPAADEDQLLVRAELRRAGLALEEADEAGGVGEQIVA